MRVARRPSQMAKLTAMLCSSKGIDLLYLRPEDIDINNNIVKGQLFDGDNWLEVETTIPILIDSNPDCFKLKNRKVMQYLRKNVYLTYDKKNSKNKHLLQEALKKDEKFSHLVIPTLTVKNFNDILFFLNQYSIIVMKPINSQKGRGVYILKKDGDDYTLGYQKKDQKLNLDELKLFYEEMMKTRKYILQKYIDSRTKSGDPFDCRVHVQKNGEGEWVVARNYIRIGIGQKVISNVNQGGGISDLIPFLKANFGDQWKEINKKINHLANTLPYKIESLKGTPSMAIGFDVAIDREGELYLFESNGAPAVKAVLARTCFLRVEYYQYMLKHIIDKEKLTRLNIQQINLLQRLKKEVDYEDYKTVLRQQDNLKREIGSVEQERDIYKKEYDKLMNSTSWKLSAPIRKIGSLSKKLKK